MKNTTWQSTLFLSMLLFLVLLACSTEEQPEKITVFAWTGGPGDASDQELEEKFTFYKLQGIDGLMYNGGHNPETYRRVGKIAKEAGLAFHTWIPTMVQGKNEQLQEEWYGVNGKGESALEKPAYVDYYKFLCPNHEGVYQYLSTLYTSVAAVEYVDGIHLDYIRFPDVILARGLWDKYGLVMDREFPEYDYCYGPKCVADFAAISGIDIKAVEDPSQVTEWKQFRYDLITKLVSRLTEDIHRTGKQVNAAVFPGPHSQAVKLVRQEWHKWPIDAVYPMHYNDFYLEKPAWVGEMTREGVTALQERIPLYSGLFICPDPAGKAEELDPEGHGLLPEELPEAIRASMDNGAAGICLFTPDRMTEKHWEALQKSIYD